MLKRNLLIITVAILTVLLNVAAQPAATETSQIVHLLNRAGYGPRPGDVERVRKAGVERYIEQQLRPETLDDSAANARLSSFDTLTADAATLQSRYRRDPRPVVEQLQSQKIIRALYSERQLQEVMVDFWFNHFNVNWSKDGVQFVTTSYERDAIRPFALGKFKDLLRATAKHPAMLVYLDNAMSTAAGINENYARELLELHTLGVDGGYTQKDIEEVARAFTGWTVSPDGGSFQFRNDLHAPGDKVVLEHTIPFGGESEGESVLEILTRQPSTARFIATKLARRFVADDPSPALVNRVARVFEDSDGDIRAMVRAILTSQEFASPSVVRAKAKSPFEAVVSSMRALNADLLDSIDDQTLQGNLRGLPSGDVVLTKTGRPFVRVSPAIVITRLIQDMGQFPYQNPEPTGYPDRSSYWMSDWSVLNRTNFAVSLARNDVLGASVNVDWLSTLLTESSAENAWKSALAMALDPPGSKDSKSTKGVPSATAMQAFALALGSPEFQHK